MEGDAAAFCLLRSFSGRVAIKLDLLGVAQQPDPDANGKGSATIRLHRGAVDASGPVVVTAVAAHIHRVGRTRRGRSSCR